MRDEQRCRDNSCGVCPDSEVAGIAGPVLAPERSQCCLRALPRRRMAAPETRVHDGRAIPRITPASYIQAGG